MVRTRSPFLLAFVEERGLIGLQLHCWPLAVEKEIPARKLANSLAKMSQYWGREVEHLDGLPKQWGYQFAESFAPPRWLLCDDQETDWTGILHTHFPKILARVAEDESRITPVIEYDSCTGEMPIARIMSEMGDWYAEYCRAEAALPQPNFLPL